MSLPSPQGGTATRVLTILAVIYHRNGLPFGHVGDVKIRLAKYIDRWVKIYSCGQIIGLVRKRRLGADGDEWQIVVGAQRI